MSQENFTSDYSTEQEINSQSRPWICGTLLLWEADRKMKQKQQTNLKQCSKNADTIKQVD